MRRLRVPEFILLVAMAMASICHSQSVNKTPSSQPTGPEYWVITNKTIKFAEFGEITVALNASPKDGEANISISFGGVRNYDWYKAAEGNKKTVVDPGFPNIPGGHYVFEVRKIEDNAVLIRATYLGREKDSR